MLTLLLTGCFEKQLNRRFRLSVEFQRLEVCQVLQPTLLLLSRVYFLDAVSLIFSNLLLRSDVYMLLNLGIPIPVFEASVG
jgi:hypothetical protein